MRYRSLFLLTSALGLACQLPEPTPEQVAQLVYVADLSDGAEPDRRCDELEARVRQFLAARPDVRLAVYALGTADMEPKILVDWTNHRREAVLFEAANEAEERQAAWVAQIGADCRARAKPSTTTSIYVALKRALAAHEEQARRLHGQGLQVIEARVALHSDGREVVDRRLRRFLRAKRPAKLKDSVEEAASDLARPDSVRVTACGLSTTTEKDRSRDPGRVERMWRVVLRDPDLVFAPSCPIPERHAAIHE